MKVVLDDGAYPPERAHADDAGLDLRTPHGFHLPPQSSYIVDTGVHVQLPKGTCGLLVSKSGLNVNHGITSTGLIDCGFQGTILVKLYNTSPRGYTFRAGEKVSQLVVLPYESVGVEVVDDLGETTERGCNGYGSTGR